MAASSGPSRVKNAISRCLDVIALEFRLPHRRPVRHPKQVFNFKKDGALRSGVEPTVTNTLIRRGHAGGACFIFVTRDGQYLGLARSSDPLPLEQCEQPYRGVARDAV